jgi:hypothetical protein
VNTLIVIVSLIIVTWASAYTVSYGIWTIKQNKIGGIAIHCMRCTAFISSMDKKIVFKKKKHTN